MANLLVSLLHKSADMEDHLSITLEPMDGFGHKRGQFGVVFHAQLIGEVAAQIS